VSSVPRMSGIVSEWHPEPLMKPETLLDRASKALEDEIEQMVKAREETLRVRCRLILKTDPKVIAWGRRDYPVAIIDGLMFRALSRGCLEVARANYHWMEIDSLADLARAARSNKLKVVGEPA